MKKIFLVIPFCFLLAIPMHLFGQAGDSPCMKDYRAGAEFLRNLDYDKSYESAHRAVSCFQANRDTVGWCKALDLEALASRKYPERAIRSLNLALKLYPKVVKDTTFVLFRLISDRSQAYSRAGLHPLVLESESQLDGMVDRLVEVDTIRGANEAFLNLLQRGHHYRMLGMLVHAQRLYQAAFDLKLRNPSRKVEPRHVADAHSGLSMVYRQQNDLAHAAEENRNAVRAAASTSLLTGQTYGPWLTFRADYAPILEDQGDYQAALDTLHRLLQEKIQMKSLLPEERATEISNIGHVLMKMGRLDSALIWMERARDIHARAGNGGGLGMAKVDINLAGILRLKKELEEAEPIAKRAIRTLEADSIFTGSNTATAWRELATIQLESGKLRDVEHSLIRSLTACLGASVRKEDPMAVANEDILAPKEFLNALILLGRFHEREYEQACEEAGLQAAFSSYGKAAALLPAFRGYARAFDFLIFTDKNRLMTGESHYRWERLWRDNYPAIEGAIRVGMQLYRLTKEERYLWLVMGVMDMCKARQIGKTIVAFGQESQSIVPRKMLDREQYLLTAIELSRTLLNRGEGTADNLPALERAFGVFKDSLRRKYPRYYAVKYESIGDSMHIAQALRHPVADDQLILEYFVGPRQVYAALRSTEGLQVEEIPGLASLQALVNRYSNGIKRQGLMDTLAPIAMELSRRLFPFKLRNPRIKHLLIAPDGFLFQVPFAALVRHDIGWEPVNNTWRIPYWAKSVAVGYDFSYSAYLESGKQALENQPVTEVHKFISMAEFHLDNIPYWPGYAKDAHEVNVYSQATGLPLTEHATADRASVAIALIRPSVVQLTAHGFAPRSNDGKGGFMALEKRNGKVDFVHASDLYTLPVFGNRLLVVNSCVSANGDYMQGEGVLSVARGFRQAGCPAVVSNLWKTSYEANRPMLEVFYRSVADGLPLDEALRRGQLAMLHGEYESYFHPYFWATLSLYGSAEPIRLD